MSRRLFFALWPPEAMQYRWARGCRQLMADYGLTGRALPPNRLHLTLLFIGSVRGEVQSALEAGADRVRSEPFTIDLERFGHWSRPQVLWFGSDRACGPLNDLVGQLHAIATELELPVESRPFRPHITLARKVRQAPRELPAETCSWPVSDFVLIESRIFPDGPIYTPIRRWPLHL